ncbi:branched-chain amino acid ABC transporter substrate-binding protein [Embleya scabrispora]|uniref:branched-chain amino acid ABC transporter substrate-binding protein n=1 Tax=Embleya scabrispora TaxID=159449 RepID=UPI002AA2AD08|nr:branched-chain amino acid ABC transporter substrate-binding protein [Embleya scabrispora]
MFIAVCEGAPMRAPNFFYKGLGFAVLKRRVIKIALPIAAAALVLSACGSDDDDDKKKDGGSSAPGNTGGGNKPTWTIGFQAGLSGENAQLGINEENGARLAVEQANAKGDLPFTLKFKTSDDEASETKSVSAAQKLIDDSNVVAVIGPAFSGPTKAASPNYAKAKLATVSPSATNPSLTNPENNFTAFLRGAPNDNAQGGGMAKYLSKKLQVKKVFVVDDKTEYGVGLSKVAKDELTKAGVQVVSDSVPKATPDYGPISTKIKNSGADAMIYAGYYQDGAPFAKKLKEAGFNGPKFSGDGTNDAQFVSLAGDAANDWFLTCPCADANVEAATKQFTEDYKKRFNTNPSTYSAESFDIANLVIDQMKSFGAEKITREAMLTKLKGASYKGLTKTFKFKQNGEFDGATTFIYQVKGGKIGYMGDIDQLVGG